MKSKIMIIVFLILITLISCKSIEKDDTALVQSEGDKLTFDIIFELLRNNDSNEALTAYNIIMSNGNTQYEERFKFGMMLKEKQLIDDAIKVFVAIIRDEPSETDILSNSYYELGLINLTRESKEMAVDLFVEALKVKKDNYPAREVLSEIDYEKYYNVMNMEYRIFKSDEKIKNYTFDKDKGLVIKEDLNGDDIKETIRFYYDDHNYYMTLIDGKTRTGSEHKNLVPKSLFDEDGYPIPKPAIELCLYDIDSDGRLEIIIGCIVENNIGVSLLEVRSNRPKKVTDLEYEAESIRLAKGSIEFISESDIVQKIGYFDKN